MWQLQDIHLLTSLPCICPAPSDKLHVNDKSAFAMSSMYMVERKYGRAESQHIIDVEDEPAVMTCWQRQGDIAVCRRSCER